MCVHCNHTSLPGQDTGTQTPQALRLFMFAEKLQVDSSETSWELTVPMHRQHRQMFPATLFTETTLQLSSQGSQHHKSIYLCYIQTSRVQVAQRPWERYAQPNRTLFHGKSSAPCFILDAVLFPVPPRSWPTADPSRADQLDAHHAHGKYLALFSGHRKSAPAGCVLGG